jgi:NTE family protein
MRRVLPRVWFGCLGIFFLAGCTAHYPVNQPRGTLSAPRQTLFSDAARDINSDDLFIVLCFSGGGTRAASFSYGALEELARTTMNWGGQQRRLLDEVDVISGVSGGSFTAAYYCLFGEQIHKDFVEKFLKADVQGELGRMTANPFNWCKLGSSYFGRSELAAEHYDRILFHGATFSQWAAQRRKPLLMINATDLATGGWFVFTQNMFDLIGSDLGSFSIARAVAASSAVPGALTPITLKNYANVNTAGNPLLVSLSPTNHPPSIRQQMRKADLESYLNTTNRPYIHLVDGGVCDNLGIRGLTETLESVGGMDEAASLYKIRNIRKLAVIIVNACADPPCPWMQTESAPGTLASLSAMIRIFMDRYNADTVDLAWSRFRRWVAHEKKVGHEMEFYPIEIKFADLADDAERTFCEAQPTSFVLTTDAVERLRKAASVLLRQSPEYQRLLRDLNATAR